MCGIAGIWGPDSSSYGERVEVMLKALAHRGPDDTGVREFALGSQTKGTVVLGSRRLAIIDSSPAGHQPMIDPVSGNALVFNGAVYNFRDLRKSMAGIVRHYTSETDTEAILYSYRYYGHDCLRHWRGMFSVAIWDPHSREIFVARDRFGIKPLYWSVSDRGEFVFASEVRAILASGLVGRVCDLMGLQSYLAYGAVQAPWTMVRGVRSLLPGHYVIVRDGKVIAERPYLKAEANPHNSSSKTTQQSFREIREQLVQVVDRCLVADVPLGAFLSGGVDSSAIVALMSRARKDDVRTFSVVFGESEFSEEKYSQLVAKKWRTNHRSILVSSDDVLNSLPNVLAAMDQPTVDGVNVYTLSKAAIESGVKVALSGLGGDEVFGGYSTFWQLSLWNRVFQGLQKLPTWAPRMAATVAEMTHSRTGVGEKLSALCRGSNSLLEAYFVIRTLFSPSMRHSLAGIGWPRDQSYVCIAGDVRTQLEEFLAGQDVFTQIASLELSSYTGNMLLRDTDVMSMAQSLEVRVPFLEHDVFELVRSLPLSVKSNRRTPKALLLEAMGDDLPKEIAARKKMGFTLPWATWLRGPLNREVDKTFASLRELGESPIRQDMARLIWGQFNKGGSVSWARVWALYVLVEWWKRVELRFPE